MSFFLTEQIFDPDKTPVKVRLYGVERYYCKTINLMCALLYSNVIYPTFRFLSPQSTAMWLK
jgi:hypothetical protein